MVGAEGSSSTKSEKKTIINQVRYINIIKKRFWNLDFQLPYVKYHNWRYRYCNG